MSETHIKKLNLKALKQDIPKNKEVSTPESVDESNIQEIKSKDSKLDISSTKMSFASIRKNTEEKAKKVTHTSKDQVQDKQSVEGSNKGKIETKQEITKTPEEIDTILLTPHDSVIEKKETKKIFGIFKGKGTSSIEKEGKIGDISQEIQFTNYESHFTKESSNFLSKFQKFKYNPKTRIGLLVSLVCITVFSIGGLMILIPDKHSPKVYKASIMQILGKEEIISDTPLKQELITPLIEEEKVQEDITPKSTKQEKSKERLRQHLLNKYSG